MRFPARIRMLLLCACCIARPLHAQLPFYTDDPAVTARGKVHFEFFNEFDVLQSQYPNLRQNTTNYKLNLGLPHNLELDLDFPYLAIFRAVGERTASGIGDTNVGVKWQFHKQADGSHAPALGVSLYTEIPTGDERRQLGSGLADYWLNFIGQEALTDKTRINMNLGYLFAGNTTTGVLGIQTTRGHVGVGGLSVLHDFTRRLSLGAEIYGGYSNNGDLARSQIQLLAGGQYMIRNGMSFDFGVLGGRYVASPRIGVQIGFSLDIPDVVRRPLRERRSFTTF